MKAVTESFTLTTKGKGTYEITGEVASLLSVPPRMVPSSWAA